MYKHKKADRNISTLESIWLCLVMCAAAAVAGAEAPRPAGWIESFTGSPEHYVLQRGGNRLPVKYYLPVYEGDLLGVINPDHSLVVAFSENESIRITTRNSPFLAKAKLEEPTLAENLMDWAGGWLTGLAGEGVRSNVTMLVTRGITDPLHMPLVEGGAGVLAANARSLCLAWQGGHPAYHVTVAATGVNPVTHLKVATNDASGCWGIDRLPSGEYELVVRDAVGQTVSAVLHAVPIQDIPRLPTELAASSLSRAATMTLYAAWLAALPDKRWVLHAYNLSAPMAKNHAPAGSLAYALQEGVMPPGISVLPTPASTR